MMIIRKKMMQSQIKDHKVYLFKTDKKKRPLFRKIHFWKLKNIVIKINIPFIKATLKFSNYSTNNKNNK